MAVIALAPLSTPAGLMERLFLHETRSPGYGASYDADEAFKAMRLMRQAVENRLKAPKLWGAPGARDEIGIIANKSQFGEFGSYPNIPASFLSQVELILALANNAKDSRHAVYAQHVQNAIVAATEVTQPVELRGLGVVAWRTAGHGSPGRNFRAVTTLQGNTFYALAR